jgi:hypothetical protein
VTQQSRFDVLDLQGLPEQRVIEQVDLADRKIIGRTPIGVQFLEFVLV